jgi:hypothetical protein
MTKPKAIAKLTQYEQLVQNATENLCERDIILYQTVLMSDEVKQLIEQIAREALDRRTRYALIEDLSIECATFNTEWWDEFIGGGDD